MKSRVLLPPTKVKPLTPPLAAAADKPKHEHPFLTGFEHFAEAIGEAAAVVAAEVAAKDALAGNVEKK